MKRLKKATGDYKGYQEDLDYTEKFDLWNGKNESLFASITAFNQTYEKNIKEGNLSADTNPYMRVFNGVSNKSLKGGIAWNLNDDLEWEATVTGENIEEINRFLIMPSGSNTVFLDKPSHTFNMNRVAESFDKSENPFNDPFMSTRANVESIIRKESFANNKNENTMGLSAIDDSGKTKPEYFIPQQQTAPMQDPNSADPADRVTQRFTVPDISKLDNIVTTQSEQQYNYFSNLPAGINTLIDMLEDDGATVRNGNTFKVTIPGADGKLATTTKGIRNLTDGKLLGETTELTIDFPEYDENTSQDKLFTGDFENQIKEYFKFKAFAANGAYAPPTYSEMEEYKGIDIPESEGPNQFTPLLKSINEIKGTTLSSDKVVEIINLRKPDGVSVLNIDQAIEYYRDTGTGEVNANIIKDLEDVKKSGKKPVFMTKDDELVELDGFKNNRISKEALNAQVTNFFKDGGEQEDFRLGSIKSKSSIKELDKDIAYYERIIKNPLYAKGRVNQERILQELKVERNSRK